MPVMVIISKPFPSQKTSLKPAGRTAHRQKQPSSLTRIFFVRYLLSRRNVVIGLYEDGLPRCCGRIRGERDCGMARWRRRLRRISMNVEEEGMLNGSLPETPRLTIVKNEFVLSQRMAVIRCSKLNEATGVRVLLPEITLTWLAFSIEKVRIEI